MPNSRRIQAFLCSKAHSNHLVLTPGAVSRGTTFTMMLNFDGKLDREQEQMPWRFESRTSGYNCDGVANDDPS